MGGLKASYLSAINFSTDVQSEEPSFRPHTHEEAQTLEPHEDVMPEGSGPQRTDALKTTDVRSPTPAGHADEPVSEESKSMASQIPVQSNNEVICNDVQITTGVEEVGVADHASNANISPNGFISSPSSQCSFEYSMIRIIDGSSIKIDETSDESDSNPCYYIVPSRKQSRGTDSDWSTQSLTAGKNLKK
uniref:Uncharacterized protein n=1 Tax=Trichuris muris TaxID=70415 RepID=A0A5S6Q5Q0_TRIMR